MRTKISTYILITTLTLALASTASAKPGNGKGGGGGKHDGGGGSGSVPISIDFRDLIDDRVGSDIGAQYVDGVNGVNAYLGSKANSGNVWLKLAKSARGLYLDFSACAANTCLTPFDDLAGSDVVDAGVISNSAIKLDADQVVTGGVLSMQPDETLMAPMRIFYDFDDGRGPGFIDFNPGVKGGNPCKNKSNFVTVISSDTNGDGTTDSWTITAEPGNRACVLLPGGGGRGSLSGIYWMPFSFTVKIL